MKHYKIYTRTVEVNRFGIDAETPEEALRLFHNGSHFVERSEIEDGEGPHMVEDWNTGDEWHSDNGEDWCLMADDGTATAEGFTYDEDGDTSELEAARADVEAQARRATC